VPISPHCAAAHDAIAPEERGRTALAAIPRPRSHRSIPPDARWLSLYALRASFMNLALGLGPAGANSAPARHEAAPPAIALGGFCLPLSASTAICASRIGVRQVSFMSLIQRRPP
jgi:hypothetical protein